LKVQEPIKISLEALTFIDSTEGEKSSFDLKDKSVSSTQIKKTEGNLKFLNLVTTIFGLLVKMTRF